MGDERQLLEQFLRSGSSDDFEPLVAQYINLVYSTALRVVPGQRGQIEDICQTVFADLSRKASAIPDQTPLAGWLHRHTCFVAANFNRSERRRQERERQAVEMRASDPSEPEPTVPNEELHLAMNELPDGDRDALVLRFLDERDLRGVGERLGISEDAAQKRVSRALEKLRQILARQGVVASLGSLTLCLGHQLTAAPASFTAKAIAATAVAGTLSTGLLPAMVGLSKAPLAKAAAIVVIGGGVAAGLFHQNRHLESLRAQNTRLAGRVAALATLRSENERLKAAGIDPDELARLRAQAAEVHDLRRRIGVLKTRAAEIPSVAAPKTAAASKPAGASPEQQLLFTSKVVARSNKGSGVPPPPGFPASGSTGILPAGQAATAFRMIEEADGFDTISGPRLITLSRRQAQIHVGKAASVVTGYFADGAGKQIETITTNINTGITIDVLGTVQSDEHSIHVEVVFRMVTFDGYADTDGGAGRKAVSEGVWYHESVPLVDVVAESASAIITRGQTMMMSARSQLSGEDFWIFLTPEMIDSTGNPISAPDTRPAAASPDPPSAIRRAP